MQSTIVMYDFALLKQRDEDGNQKKSEFVDFSKHEERIKLKLRVLEISDAIRSLHMLFGGDVLTAMIQVTDQHKNKVLLDEEPLILLIPFWLSHREIEYIKDLNSFLIVIM